MNDVVLFPPIEPSPWSPDQLEEALADASPHVRYLLKELSDVEAAAPADLKSKSVAYAIVQRICNSARRESLILASHDPHSRGKVYRLNPTYRGQVRELVKGAELPVGEARIPYARRKTQRRATDSSGVAAQPVQLTQRTAGRSMALPSDVALEVWQMLIAFLHSTSNTRYRIVLDVGGPRIEVAAP